MTDPKKSHDSDTSSKLFDCIAISSVSFCKNALLVAEARKLAKRVILNDAGQRFDETGMINFIKDLNADAVIIGVDPCSAKVIDAAKNLKAIGKYGVGCDNVDLEYLKQKGIYFAWQGGVNRRSVSELALGFMLGHQRNIFRGIDRMQHASWQKDGGRQLSEKTIGIIGFGFIGTDLAKLLAPFNCKILIHDILDKTNECQALNARQVAYEELLKKSDIISFHVPGGAATKHMFSDAQIKITKPGALIVNTARGSIIDFKATSNAVRLGFLSGYASDVFPEEPFLSKDYPVEAGFYFTPHIGGNAQEAILSMGLSAVDGLRAYLGHN